jgi:hypothetical protein
MERSSTVDTDQADCEKSAVKQRETTVVMSSGQSKSGLGSTRTTEQTFDDHAQGLQA